MVNSLHCKILCCLLLLAVSAVAFQALQGMKSGFRKSILTMRDGSTASTYFNVGDKVRVVENVWHNPPTLPTFSSKDLEGIICGVWEKCEVDPSCCCAELAFDAPIEVQFEGAQYNEGAASWTAHFAFDEIVRVLDLNEAD